MKKTKGATAVPPVVLGKASVFLLNSYPPLLPVGKDKKEKSRQRELEDLLCFPVAVHSLVAVDKPMRSIVLIGFAEELLLPVLPLQPPVVAVRRLAAVEEKATTALLLQV